MIGYLQARRRSGIAIDTEPAVDGDDLASEVAGLSRCQKRDDLGYLPRFGQSALRDASRQRGFVELPALHPTGHHLCARPAGRDRVHADAASGPFQGEGTGEAGQSRLRGGVRDAARDADEPADRADVDDRAAAREHVARGGSRAPEHRGQIRVDHPDPVVVNVLFGGAAGDHAGAVHQHGYRTDLPQHQSERLVYGAGRPYVER